MRTLLIVTLLLGFGTVASPAQEWTGTAGVGLSGGHQTNLYLDPVIGTWNPGAESPFVAVTPRLGLSRNGRQTQIDLTIRGRIHTRQADAPQHLQSFLRFRRSLSENWSLGLVGGGTRYRYPALDQTIRTVRDSWWALPSVRWTPTTETMLTLRTGLTQRFEKLPSVTDRQTSALASLRATHWLTDRVRGGASVYYSSGRTSTAETGFGGSGGSLSTTYWPTDAISIKGEVAVERLHYETVQSTDPIRDRIGRADLTVDWSPRSFVSVFGRARALRATLGAGDRDTDVHASVGVRLQVQHSLGGSVDLPPPRRVCQTTEKGVLMRVPYEGNGKLHVTGDFNGWSLPGVPMEPSGDDAWQTTLELSPGQYSYRLRVVDDNGSHWLDLPTYARTAEDPFGGTNGVCIVQ